MTQDSLKLKLTTHATTAGFAKIFYDSPEIWNINRTKQDTSRYPGVVFYPTQWVIPVMDKPYFDITMKIWIINDMTKAARALVSDTDKQQVWDYCTTLMSVLQAQINTDSNLEIVSDLTGDLMYPGDVGVDKDMGVMFSCTLRIYC